MNDTSAVRAESYAQEQLPPGGSSLLSAVVRLRIALIAALMAALFWPNLVRLWLKTNPFTGEANWQHSVFVPLIAIYYLYLNREALFSNPQRQRSATWRWFLAMWLELQFAAWGILFFVRAYYPPAFRGASRQLSIVAALFIFAALTGCITAAGSRRDRSQTPLGRFVRRLADTSSAWFGFYLMIWGIILYAWAIYPGRNDFLKDFGMVVTLFGVVLLTCGWAVMRTSWFPIVFLITAIPWPELFYSRVALPLQKLSANAAVLVLKLTGVEADVSGTIISMQTATGGSRQLNVAEACAGLKSLMTFIAIGAAVGFLSSRRTWQKLTIMAAAVPIAILANMTRVAGQGLLDRYVSTKLSESFAHQFVGLVMLIPAFLLLLVVAWVVDQLVVEEVEDLPQSAPGRDSSELIIEIPRARVARPDAPTPDRSRQPAPSQPAPPEDLASAALRLASLRRGGTRQVSQPNDRDPRRQEEQP